MNKQIDINEFTDEQLAAFDRFVNDTCIMEDDKLYYTDNKPITKKQLLYIFQDSDYFPK